MTWSLRDLLARAVVGAYGSRRRSIYETFDYPAAVTNELLEQLYLRGGIAHRVINAFPGDTWATYPGIRDERGNSSVQGDRNYSPFFAAAEALFEQHTVLAALERADRLASIGRFGVLLLGFNDGVRDLSRPLEPRTGLKLLYLQAYGQPTVSVSSYDMDPQSPRFGLPLIYTMQSSRSSDLGSATTPPSAVLNVHYSRVIHIAERMMEDGVNGVPRLLPIYNRLLDLEKTLGGGAEAFWRNADPGMSIAIDKDAQVDQGDIDAMKKEAREMRERWEKTMVGVGFTATQMTSSIADPGPIVDKIMEEIAGGIGMPKRILVGSERGELSSTQDTSEWGKVIRTRRTNFADPFIVRPFVDLMIRTGNLPPPEGQWWCDWMETDVLDPLSKAQASATKATALASYANAPAAAIIVPPAEFRERFLDLPPEPEYEDELTELPESEDTAEVEPETAVQNAAARSLFAYRPVLNTGAILAWARKQGITDLQPADQLHVTLAYSPAPFDWMRIAAPFRPDDDESDGRITIPPGGVRIVERFEPSGAIALMFSDMRLQWRHDEIKAAGAQWSHAEYQPHITLSYSEQPLHEVEPYTGPIVLGPEVFQEIDR